MEALLILFAPLIEICLAPVIAILGAILSMLFELLLFLLWLIFGLKSERRKRTKPLIPRKVVHWSAGVLLAFGMIGVVFSFVFFDQILRYGLNQAEAKTGVHITSEGASGNLLSGRVALDGVAMRGAGDSGLGFDVTARHVALDVALFSLIFEPRVQLAEVAGVRGLVSLPAAQADRPKPTRKESRAFSVDDIRVSDVVLNVQPQSGAAYPFEITQANVTPFRSGTALFDLLFRSNMQATIAGQSLFVETREITEYGRSTKWRFEEIEADKLKLILPRAPLTWLEGGAITARVDDQWSLSEDWIEMDWNLSFRDVQVVAPDQAGLGERMLSSSFATLLKAKGGSADFGYALSFDQRQIAVARSGDLSAFWDIVADELIGGAKSDVARRAAETADGKVKGAIDRFKGLFDRDEAAD